MKSPFSQKTVQVIILSTILIISIATATYALYSTRTIPTGGSIYYQPEAKILLNDGFETGNFNAWNGTQTTTNDQATVASIKPYDGTYHAGFQTTAITSGTKYAYTYFTLATPITEIYTRAYFYIADGLPLDDNDDRFGLIAFEVNSQLQCTFRVHRSGNKDKFDIIGLNGTNTIQKGTDAIYPTEGQWFCIEFYIKVHSIEGEYRAWINGVEQITLTNLNLATYGIGVTRIRVGLTSTINVQHSTTVLCDSAVISTRHIGQLYTFAIIGNKTENPAIANFEWLFGNQTIKYKTLTPSQVTSSLDIDLFDGLIVWTRQGGYNSEAVKKFAQTRIVISHIGDFCNRLYPSLSSSTQTVSTTTVTYVRDWGVFSNGDIVDMRNETGNTNTLTAVLASALATFSNTSKIAQYDSNRIVFFHMNGTRPNSGFFTMDLDATTPETEWTGIWHVFPPIKIVHDFPTGKYAKWMANGRAWWNLDWVYNRIDTIVNQNSDIVKKYIMGYSVEGRPIPIIKIGTGNRYIIIDGSIHGCEKTGTFASLRIAELLIQYYRYDSYWKSRLTNFTVLIIPVLNPDGFVRNTRENANGIDLNRQFPPDGTTTEPEAWALRWLMGNCTPTIYINIHEGGQWYPLEMMWGNYETGTNKTITRIAMQEANQTFTQLKHWGWYTEYDNKVWIGKVKGIYSAGITSMAVAYASYTYGSSCMLLETFVWSQSWGARKSLWGIDYYTAVIISFLQNIQR